MKPDRLEKEMGTILRAFAKELVPLIKEHVRDDLRKEVEAEVTSRVQSALGMNVPTKRPARPKGELESKIVSFVASSGEAQPIRILADKLKATRDDLRKPIARMVRDGRLVKVGDKRTAAYEAPAATVN